MLIKELYSVLLNRLYFYRDIKYAFITKTWKALLNDCYLVRRNIYKNILEKQQYFTGKVLDFGCGKKPYRELFKNANEYIGLEYATPDINFEFEKFADYFYDGNTFPFDNDTFDNIVSFQVLEHIPNPEQILSELNRVLKQNGYLLISFDFAFYEHFQPYDYYRFTRFQISNMLKNAGFETIEIKESTTTFETICLLLNIYITKYIKNKTLTFVITYLINIFSILLLKFMPEDKTLPEGLMIFAKKNKDAI